MLTSSPTHSSVKRFSYILAIAAIVVLSACGAANVPDSAPVASNAEAESAAVPPGSCGLLDGNEDVADAIRRVLQAEGELVVAQDIDPLMALWDADATITDAKYTPSDQSDDQVWNGRDAIRHRYVRIVFPGAPGEAQPADLQTSITDNSAVVTATTQIGTEVSPQGDRWELINVDGCWLLNSLTYNMEEQTQ